MISNPCDRFDYNSDEYNSCVKDVVYEAAQDEWIMLDPRFPNLKGVIPERIDELIQIFAEESQKLREYCIDYLQHVMIYDRDDIFKMCINLGEQIEKKYPGKLHDPHSIFVTTPRGGHEVLSIFAYANDFKKEQIPSHIRSINKNEQKIINRAMKSDKPGFITAWAYGVTDEAETTEDIENAYRHIQEGNLPIIPDIWINTLSNYFRNKVETVFIIDDIIASGEQMQQAVPKLLKFFNEYRTVIIDEFVEVIPVVLVKRKDWFYEHEDYASVFKKTVYDTETLGIYKWNMARHSLKKAFVKYEEVRKQWEKDFDSLITVRFPWGSPDGESDRILTKLYEGRRGLDRMERKQRRCILDPDQCELK